MRRFGNKLLKGDELNPDEDLGICANEINFVVPRVDPEGMRILRFVKLTVFAVPLLLGSGPCKKSESAPAPAAEATVAADPRYLYVASGACYAGGVATSAGSATISRFNLSTGAKETIIDYTLSPGDFPVGMVDYDSDSILTAVENASGRRIDSVNKRGLGRSTFLSNSTALSGVLRSLKPTADGGLLVAKVTAVERFNSSRARVTAGASPYINAPAAPCATVTTAMIDVVELSNGKMIFAHAAATPNNRFGIISSSGYNVAGDCLAAQAAPTTTALPTAMLYLPGGNLLVAYGSTTSTSNFIYAYSINETTNAITGATVAYSNVSVVNGPSAMVYDPETELVYVANGISSYNSIEKFTFDSTAKTLTRVGSTPFINATVETRCISGMVVSN